jgi:hypothetical protein
LDCPFPALADKYGLSFNFEIDLKYSSGPSKLSICPPLPGWLDNKVDGRKEVSAIQLTPFDEQTPVIETIKYLYVAEPAVS